MQQSHICLKNYNVHFWQRFQNSVGCFSQEMINMHCTKVKFLIKYFFSKCDQICGWQFLMKNFIFWHDAVMTWCFHELWKKLSMYAWLRINQERPSSYRVFCLIFWLEITKKSYKCLLFFCNGKTFKAFIKPFEAPQRSVKIKI